MRIQEAVPVEEAARAHRLIESGHTTGKLVLVF
ncbi:zinc-binding dehydrogenase [Microbispora sp. H10885]|nr:zinc-binding dehydrogenase [Microbispora sp. H10885]